MAVGDGLDKALQATKETKRLDFKEQFDPGVPGDLCEVLKDFVAMANSGGGLILVGLKNDGSPTGLDVSPILDLDSAKLVDQMSKYTGQQFDDFSIQPAVKNECPVACVTIGASEIPLVFMRPGTYDIGGGKQQTAFSRGTVYFRHGAKSEPGTSKDLRDAFERLLKKYRRSLLQDLRRIVSSPTDDSEKVAGPVTYQIVDDASAPGVGLLDTNTTHPYLQSGIIKIVNERLQGQYTVNPHDILSVRRVRGIDHEKPWFCYKPLFGSLRYTPAFADWLVNQYETNWEFFSSARADYKLLQAKKETG